MATQTQTIARPVTPGSSSAAAGIIGYTSGGGAIYGNSGSSSSFSSGGSSSSNNSSSNSSNSSSSNNSSSNIVSFNPNTGQPLSAGQTVQIGNTGQFVTQGTPFISASTLGNTPVTMPSITDQKYAPSTDYKSLLESLSKQTITPFDAQTKAIDTSANTQANFAKMLQEAIGTPPSVADAYKQAQQETDILNKQQIVNDLSSQLNTITANSQANQLRVIGQGRGIPEAIIGGQQAQIGREAAINALPVAAQLSAAQGNLDMANRNLETLFKIKVEDATAQYQYKKDVVTSVMNIASKAESVKLDVVLKKIDQEYESTLNLQKEQQAYAKMAMDNNQANIGSKIASLDYKSPTFRTDLSKLQSQIKDPMKELDIALKKAQINNQYVNTAKTKAEIEALKTPGAGKPLTQSQIEYAGYADRIAQANNIIDSKKDTFANMNYAQFMLASSNSQAANSLVSDDVRQVSQAMRNFITAKLRKESGASISPSEFADARLQYFPAYGDDATTLANKKALRDSVLQNNILGAGNAYNPSNPSNSNLDSTDIYFQTSSNVINEQKKVSNENMFLQSYNASRQK